MDAIPSIEQFEAAELEKAQALIAELQGSNNRISRQLLTAKASKSELVAAVKQAAYDAAMGLTFPPVPLPRFDQRPGEPEVAIMPLADWQLGKLTPSYNSDVCEERIERLADKIEKLVAIQRQDHPVREARIYLLGDIIEGEQIFPGQAFRIDSSLFHQITTVGPRILGTFVRRMCGLFDKVHVDGVIGNHGALFGRTSRDAHPETNGDAMLYENVAQYLARDLGSDRLTWAPNFILNERKWYSVDRVGQQAFLLFHGDQIKGGFAGYAWYGFGKKLQGWRGGAIKEPFNYSLSGHFHTPVRFQVGHITHWGSGSPESDNTYAAEMLAAMGTPNQWLMFCHPDSGITSEYQVHLTDEIQAA